MVRGTLAVLVALTVVVAGPAGSGTAARAEQTVRDEAEQRRQLYDALGVDGLIEVMRREGAVYGDGIGAEFLGDSGAEGWAAVVARIYDRDKMRASAAAGLDAGIGAADLAPLIAFFTSETGQRIVQLELTAREAFLDPEAEDRARAAYLDAETAVTEGKDAALARRLELLEAYVAVNDLVEFNVAGALTANLRFYRGLADGGAWETTEEDMLIEVWGQEEEIRADTVEWLMAYLLLAYAPLTDDELAEYVALSERPEGRVLNKALFAGFDAMYADLSYALGLAMAVQLQGEDL